MKYIIVTLLSILSLESYADDNRFSLVITHKSGARTIVPTGDVDSVMIVKHTADEGYDDCFDHASDWYVNIENPVVAKYMNEVDYTGYEKDYSFSYMPEYRSIDTPYRIDQPRGVEVVLPGGEEQAVVLSLTKDFSADNDTFRVEDYAKRYVIYNLFPDKRYYYKVLQGDDEITKSHFTTIGQVRMMHLPSIRNVRDLGGWRTDDGGCLRYGLIYRGGEMNTSARPIDPFRHDISSEDSTYMHDKMHIRLDMDLRDNRDLFLNDSDPDNDLKYTPLGQSVEWKNEMVDYHTEAFTKFAYYYNNRWTRCIRYIINTLKNGNSVYIHCTFGADRTGTLAMLIEALCGVSESDICKDYELTSWYHERYRTMDYWGPNIQFMNMQMGTTFKECAESYCIRAGLTKQEIEELRSLLVSH